MKLGLVGYGKMGKMIESLAFERGYEIVPVPEADVCFEFTKPDAVVGNARMLTELGKQIVIGTTGWEGDREIVRGLVEAAGVGCVYAANFSLGMQIFYRLAMASGELLRGFPQYDVSGHEVHHREKVDRPSGSAKKLAQVLAGSLQRGSAEELEFSSERCGFVPGKHSVRFDSVLDTITLTHEVRSRATFAEGALWAAEWVVDKKGFFALEEVVEEVMKK